jgi:hypothetical protein
LASPCAEVLTIQYPLDVNNEKARNEYKNKLLTDNPEPLFANCYKNGNIGNIIFHTDHCLAWRSDILTRYPSVKGAGVLAIGGNSGVSCQPLQANVNLYELISTSTN